MLFSVAALKKAKSVIDFEKQTIRFKHLGPKEVKLKEAPSGHLLLPLFNFHTERLQQSLLVTGPERSERRQRSVALLRRLARDTHGPWVSNDSMPLVQQILELVAAAPSDSVRLVLGQAAYRARV